MVLLFRCFWPPSLGATLGWREHLCAVHVYALFADGKYVTAIWDNRSVYHTMTLDYQGLGERFGNRAVGIGERPYYDPKSTSRREDLGIPYIQQ